MWRSNGRTWGACRGRPFGRDFVWKWGAYWESGYCDCCNDLHAHGVDSGLDFANMQEIKEAYERLTDMQVSMREPYAGELVFTAFSGYIRMLFLKGWHTVRNQGNINGQSHTCQLTRRMLEGHMIQMLSGLTASPGRAAWHMY